MDDRAQMSVELILVLAAVLAVAYLLVSNLTGTAHDAVKEMKGKGTEVVDAIKGI